MKKYRKIAYISIVLVFLIMVFCMYTVVAKNETDDTVKEKTLAGVKHLENELVNLFNEINNIKYENYTIYATKANEEEDKQGSSETPISEQSSSGKNSKGGQSSESGQESSSGGQSSEGKQDNSSQGEETSKEYKLQEKGVLTRDEEVNWVQIKNDVEKIYVKLNSVEIDLQKILVSQEEFSIFNSEFYILTIAVKEEDRERALEQLSKLYDFLPSFVEKCDAGEKELIIVKTKNYILKAYSILEKEDWDSISSFAKEAYQEFSRLFIGLENNKNVNEYNVKKIHLMLNEFQNSINMKNKEVFLIKYKNLLEELENV